MHGAGHSAFTLQAEVLFFDENGVQIGIGSADLVQHINTGNGLFPGSDYYAHHQDIVESAMVRFSFMPSQGNTNTVKIDDGFWNAFRWQPILKVQRMF